LLAIFAADTSGSLVRLPSHQNSAGIAVVAGIRHTLVTDSAAGSAVGRLEIAGSPSKDDDPMNQLSSQDRQKRFIGAMLSACMGGLAFLLFLGKALKSPGDEYQIIWWLGVAAAVGMVLFAIWGAVRTYRI